MAEKKDKIIGFLDLNLSTLGFQKKGELSQEAYYQICLETLKIDGKCLETVEPENLTADQYFDICFAAVDQNGLSLEWVRESYLDVEKYHKLSFRAVKQNGFSIFYVKKEYFQNDQKRLRVLYNIAVHQNSDALQLIQDQNLTVCLIAVENNASALQWVNPNLFLNEYENICFQAFHQKQAVMLIDRIFGSYFDIKNIQNYQALRFVNKDFCYPEKYKQICLQAIKYCGECLPFVDASLWQDKEFCMEAQKISGKAKNYFKNI